MSHLKKYLLFIITCLFIISCNKSKNNLNSIKKISEDLNEKPEEVLYICKGKYSKRYHLRKTCHGLNSCSTDIHVVTYSEAINMGRTLCGFED